MALISRYLLQVKDPDFVAAAPPLFRDWLGWKLHQNDFELPENDAVHPQKGGSEVRVRTAEKDELAGFRGNYFEQRSSEQIRTTFTALSDSKQQWAWIDLERWSEDPFSPGWIPAPPRILIAVLRHAQCYRGPTRLGVEFSAVKGKNGGKAAQAVLDPEREVPIVVTTPTKQELNTDLRPARERARELQSLLCGIAPVILLEKGALESFSKEILRAGARIDVHGGAVRTYLPGAGRQGDSSRRHRVIPFERLRKRPADTAAKLVVLPLTRAACHTVPPRIWAEGLRDPLVVGEKAPTDEELVALLELAEAERKDAERQTERADEDKWEAMMDLESERETVADLLDQSSRLSRRLDYAQRQIREAGKTPEEPPDDIPTPDYCSEVTDLVNTECPDLVLGPNVAEAAESLDAHAHPSWARKAWQSFQAMQAYAVSKRGGEESSSSLFAFCDRGQHSDVIPTSWIASGESETTNQNQEFRRQRTFQVPNQVDSSGAIYMPAHIKIEQGGDPAPRIHYYDDTDGATNKIHIGWFGPHRDSKAKS